MNELMLYGEIELQWIALVPRSILMNNSQIDARVAIHNNFDSYQKYNIDGQLRTQTFQSDENMKIEIDMVHQKW